MTRAAALLVTALLASPAQSRSPNVVLIVADDLGCFELGCYGQKLIKTPHIDALAAGGMRFTRFYAGNAVCAPSRCALMTGKHMGHATIRDNRQFKKGEEGQQPIRAEDVTVAELLKAKGYATGAMGKWGLGNWDTPGSPMKHGFDLFFGYNCQAHAHSHYPTHVYRNGTRIDLKGNDGKAGTQYTQDLCEAEGLAFIEANKAKPFFLFLPFIVPHVAVQVPDDSLNEYKGKLGDDPPYDGKKGYLPHPTPHAAYAAMVTRMDRSVGRVVEKLKALGLEKDTLILFTSDNGPTHNVGGADSTFFHSAGKLRGLKGSLYEGGIRVPLLAYWPGTVKPGTTCDAPYYFPNVMPTLCELVGTKPPKGTEDISLVPALKGEKTLTVPVMYWEFPGYGGQQAIRSGDMKAVRQALGKGVVKTELYDLSKDEGETTDVAAKYPNIVEALDALMKHHHTPSALFPLQTIDPPAKKK